ncbi:class I SAM-dependent methyltransferase [Nocardia abscessus]|uniref:class I SAM-dependent methyltransferase n=1 Tax=Nocardia abscessus TaxID=120957 RepID=UPI001895CBDC|nr:class I SAM-dependent methyltransferase [Nocardia abscessus]MBF6334653.1 class I SAM-dependent methyltransferase [Nocardia abscessus]
MPTISSPEEMPHRQRQIAESFGVDSERYDRARPSYPEAMIDQIVSACPGTEVLDVGCGTGVEARQFRATGCTVLGVEPDPRMADFARRQGLAVEVATFEDWDAAGRVFDAVVAGTAWHWVDPVAGAAKAARVLRPGGLLAAFWHVFHLPAEVAEAYGAVYRRVAPNSPIAIQPSIRALDGYRPILARTADGIREAGRFDDPLESNFEWERTYTRDEWLDQLPTHGPLTRLPQDDVAQVLDGVGAAIDAMGGGFTLPYTTVAITAARTGTR